MVLKEFGAPPYFFTTSSSSSFAFPLAIAGSMAFILCVLFMLRSCYWTDWSNCIYMAGLDCQVHLMLDCSHARQSEFRTSLLDRPRRGDPLAHRRGRCRFDLRAWRGTNES